RAQLLASAKLLGLLQADPQTWLRGTSTSGLSDDEIEQKIKDRIAARANKDFATSDAIRDELLASGIILEDGQGGTSWRRV
ncbi:MAG: cysteine--tRNA ligase, partial [Rhodospirillaceae bacterium]|nr:cysteine--tRNA ligase [Rhodospirillaceae bacterium]